MITKKRLEELIEQGATIYDLSSQFEPFEIDFLKVKIHGFFNDGVNFYIECPTAYNGHQLIFCEYKDLYEFKTKEDAEEYAEFGNITRTERLPYLPKWEDIEYENGFFIRKFHIKDNYNGLGKLMVIKDSVILVQCSSLGVLHEEYFNKPATRENYNEARRLCVKLFKGEE